MKKITPIVSLLLLLVMTLTACGSAAESTETAVVPLETDVLVETPEDTLLETPTEELLETPTEAVMETPTEEVMETPEATDSGESTEATATSEGIAPTGPVDASRLSNLLDFAVENESGEEIGEVEDFILDLGKAQIEYVVVNQGGLLSTAPTVSVPWEAFEVQTEPTTAFVLLVDQASLETAPEIDLDALPELGEPAVDWDVDFRTYWDTPFSDAGITVTEDTTPDTTETGGFTGLALASELLDAELTVGLQGENEAEIDDALVDIETGDLTYLVVLIDLDGTGDRWVLVPVNQASFGYDTTAQVYTFDVDIADLGTVPSFDVDVLPDTQVENWDDEIKAWWDSFVDDTP